MRRLGRVKVAVAALAAALVPGSPVAPQEAAELPINDAHVHLVDFLQNGDFLENGELVASGSKPCFGRWTGLGSSTPWSADWHF